jgi:SAM-dependent methyltransferase
MGQWGNAKQRILAPPVNSSRHHLRAWAAEAAAVGSDRSFWVLDAGAGDAPYRDLFSHVTYETADFGELDKEYAHIDHVCDLAAMPMADSTYDMVFSSQTMEHMPDPLRVLREFHRVLRPGGQAWLSAPFFYAEHEQPYDFYRYTQFAWRYLAEQAGFEVKEVTWLEGYYGTLSYQLHIASDVLRRQRRRTLGLAMLILARRFARMDIDQKLVGQGLCKNYRVTLVKPKR